MSANVGMAAQANPATSKEVTHIEIRRVQNGFVVMAVDYRKNHSFDAPMMQRAAFVAQDLDALKALIENIVSMAELNWLPTADVPMLDMQRIVENAQKQRAAVTEEEITRRVAERAAHLVQQGSVKVVAPPGQYSQNTVYGGPLNK